MEDISEYIGSDCQLNNSKKEICYSKNFYQSFDYENSENKSKDSQETIMPEEESENKIILNLQNNEIRKKKKISTPNQIDIKFSFINEESFYEENNELGFSAIDIDNNDISNKISQINYLCRNEIEYLYNQLKRINDDYFADSYFR